jgi:hypothetical protein
VQNPPDGTIDLEGFSGESVLVFNEIVTGPTQVGWRLKREGNHVR